MSPVVSAPPLVGVTATLAPAVQRLQKLVFRGLALPAVAARCSISTAALPVLWCVFFSLSALLLRAAIIIARTYVRDDNLDLVCRPVERRDIGRDGVEFLLTKTALGEPLA